MKNIPLNEELLNQLRLIKYDRSKTLLEQTLKNDLPKPEPFRQGEYTGDVFMKNLKNTEYLEYKNLSKEDKEKYKNEWLNKEWKGKLCTKSPNDRGSVPDGVGGHMSHEEFCSPFGGTQIYPSTSSVILGQGYFCGCKVNGETNIGSRLVKVNEYLNRPYTEITYGISEFLGDPHNLAMVGSIALSLFGGPAGAILALGIDALEFGVYLEEGDPYMAGLSLVFTLIPFSKLSKIWLKSGTKLGELTKDKLKTILDKIFSKKALSKGEQTFVEKLTDKSIMISLTKNMIKARLMDIIKKYDVIYLIRFFMWLIKNGFLTTKFLAKWGLIIGGVFYSWGKLAELLGIKEKVDTPKGEESTYNQGVGMVKGFLNDFKKNTNTFSIQTGSSQKPFVVILQYVLYAGGYFEQKTPTYDIRNNSITVTNNGDLIKNISIYSVSGSLLESYDNDNHSKKFTLKKYLNKGTSILVAELFNGKKVKSQIINIPNKQQLNNLIGKESKVVTPNWGIYDNITKDAVMLFQYVNKLPVDGVIGKNTIDKMISLINGGDITSSNIDSIYNKVDFDFKTNLIDSKKLESLNRDEIKKIVDEKIKENMSIIRDSFNIELNPVLFSSELPLDTL